MSGILLGIWVISLYLVHDPLQVSRAHFPMFPLSIVGAIAATGVIYFCCDKFLLLHLSIADFIIWLGEVSLVILCLHELDLVFPMREWLGITNPITAIIFDLTYCILGTVLLSQSAVARNLFKIKKVNLKHDK